MSSGVSWLRLRPYLRRSRCTLFWASTCFQYSCFSYRVLQRAFVQVPLTCSFATIYD